MKRVLSCALVGALLFSSDVAFQRLDWPVARVHAAIAFINAVAVSYTTGSTDTTKTSGALNTAGATLSIVGTSANTTTCANTPTDSSGNTYTPLTQSPHNLAGEVGRIYYTISPTTNAAETWTITSTTGCYMTAWIANYSGTGIYDSRQTSQDAGSGTTLQPGSLTTSGGTGLYVLLCGWGDVSADANTVSVDLSFNLRGQTADGNDHYGLGIADKSSTGPENPTCTTSGTQPGRTANMAVFQTAAATTNHRLLSATGAAN